MRRLIASIFLLTSALAAAHPIPPIAGVFSNFTYNEAEGDISGLEVTVLPSGSEGAYTYHALIQVAEGVPMPPQLVPLKYDGTNVVFSFSYPGAGMVTFMGRLSGKALVGKIAGAKFMEAKYTLPRASGFWQPPTGK